LGLPDPSFAHVPLVLGPDGARLAKRDGAVTLQDRLDLGETIPQLVGALANSLGLAPAGAPTTLAELATTFDADTIDQSPWRLTHNQLESGL
jgi:glutamyl-tRNA synthetase